MEKYFRLLLFPVLISFTEGQNCTAEDGTEGIELWEDCYSIENTQSINLVCVMCPASQKLQGPIPPEIGLLTNLTVLNILLNNISGPIPSEIGDVVIWDCRVFHRAGGKGGKRCFVHTAFGKPNFLMFDFCNIFKFKVSFIVFRSSFLSILKL